METFTLNVFDKPTENGFMPTLKAYIIDGMDGEEEKRPAVVILPGSAYTQLCDREGERVALAYSACGFHTFVLDYCVAPNYHPLPILCIAKAIELIREKADEWKVASDKIAVCGFSAGGHLAASVSTMWNDKKIFTNDEEKNRLHRPDATVLCYPVISGGEYSHTYSFKQLTGTEKRTPLWEELSLEKRVDDTTPPAFLWHTLGDLDVPAENSILYASALRQYGTKFEMHIYPDGSHGMSLVTDELYWGKRHFVREYPWFKQSVEWLYLQFGIMDIEG